MQLEAVGGVPMGDMGFEVGWQIDDINGAKGAFLRTDAATNTQAFRNESDLRFWGDFDAEAATSDNRARLLAFLPAFLYDLGQGLIRLAWFDRYTFGLHCKNTYCEHISSTRRGSSGAELQKSHLVRTDDGNTVS